MAFSIVFKGLFLVFLLRLINFFMAYASRTVSAPKITGSFIELYTPAPGQIVSPGLNQAIEAAQWFITGIPTTSATITFTPYAGTVAVSITYPCGTVFPYPVRQITACSAAVYIVHDGLVSQSTN